LREQVCADGGGLCRWEEGHGPRGHARDGRGSGNSSKASRGSETQRTCEESTTKGVLMQRNKRKSTL